MGGHEDADKRRHCGHAIVLFEKSGLDYSALMGKGMANFATIGAGGLFGMALVAGYNGAFTLAWSFFFDGLIEHYMSLQVGLFSCF
jgi:hypothetical protein